MCAKFCVNFELYMCVLFSFCRAINYQMCDKQAQLVHQKIAWKLPPQKIPEVLEISL